MRVRRAPCSSSSRTRPNTLGLTQRVTPHRLRASVATLLLDAGIPSDQVQKFLRHKHLSTTQIYAETSLRSLGEHYLRAFS
jgi:integrase/recombinase XerD